MSGSKLLLTVLICCLALVVVYLIVGYFSDRSSRNEMESRIDTSTQTLIAIAQPPENLDEQLQQAQAENQAAKKYLTGDDIDITRTIDALLKKADERQLKANPLSTGQWSNNTLAGSAYSKLPVEMVVAGRQSDLVLFLADLENAQLFPSLAVEDMTVTNLDSGNGGEAAVSVKLDLALVKRLDAAG